MDRYSNRINIYQGSDSNNNFYTYNVKNDSPKNEIKTEKKIIKIVCILFIIRVTIAALLITLNLVWLYPIKNYAKKEEPTIEVRTSLVLSHNNNVRILDYSKSNCDSKLEQFLEKGAYETFFFDMNKIHKYANIFIIIIYIHVGLVGISILIVLIWDVAIIYTTIDGIIILINLIIFAIFSIFNNKGEYDVFEAFSECYFFNKEKFIDVYDYIFKLRATFKKDFILNIILLPFSCLAGYFISCTIKKE